MGEMRLLYLKTVDYNRNGVIEFDEFVDLMMRDYETIDYKADIYAAFRYKNHKINQKR